ncbi:MAG: exodeoxyribonuclease VII large subunit [Actinobacteria bacterium]|nr:exodeoxyribonuclease VII large subunit [Actinomycetota bacterium]
MEPVTVVDPALPGKDPQTPVPVSGLSAMMADYVGRLGTIWVEGQIAELSTRGGLSFVSLRDVDSDATIKLFTWERATLDVSPPIEQGSRVIAQVKADWWKNKGTLQFKILQIRAVGIGELLARLEALRNVLAAEGLFAEERKKPIPFLPRRIGLICGKNSDAKHDVIENTRRRWPEAEFEVREVKVQGATAVREVCQALTELDAISDIDVIVIARGGGSFEDLLPFSDESLIRTISAAQSPIVVAIGHEEDRPLVDYVADYRASTPTDAANKIVPDLMEEIAFVIAARNQLASSTMTKISRLGQELAQVKAKPALANPSVLIDQRITANSATRNQLQSKVFTKVQLGVAELKGITGTLRALSPQGTLDRGYAIARNAKQQVIKSTNQISEDETITVKVADGLLTVQVIRTD